MASALPPVHTYTSPGTYTITTTVTDACTGLSDTTTDTYVVRPYDIVTTVAPRPACGDNVQPPGIVFTFELVPIAPFTIPANFTTQWSYGPAIGLNPALVGAGLSNQFLQTTLPEFDLATYTSDTLITASHQQTGTQGTYTISVFLTDTDTNTVYETVLTTYNVQEDSVYFPDTIANSNPDVDTVVDFAFIPSFVASGTYMGRMPGSYAIQSDRGDNLFGPIPALNRERPNGRFGRYRSAPLSTSELSDAKANTYPFWYTPDMPDDQLTLQIWFSVVDERAHYEGTYKEVNLGRFWQRVSYKQDFSDDRNNNYPVVVYPGAGQHSVDVLVSKGNIETSTTDLLQHSPGSTPVSSNFNLPSKTDNENGTGGYKVHSVVVNFSSRRSDLQPGWNMCSFGYNFTPGLQTATVTRVVQLPLPTDKLIAELIPKAISDNTNGNPLPINVGAYFDNTPVQTFSSAGENVPRPSLASSNLAFHYSTFPGDRYGLSNPGFRDDLNPEPSFLSESDRNVFKTGGVLRVGANVTIKDSGSDSGSVRIRPPDDTVLFRDTFATIHVCGPASIDANTIDPDTGATAIVPYIARNGQMRPVTIRLPEGLETFVLKNFTGSGYQSTFSPFVAMINPPEQTICESDNLINNDFQIVPFYGEFNDDNLSFNVPHVGPIPGMPVIDPVTGRPVANP